MRHINDSGVSPVVGVMLMLVVTIVIAAVVSAFSGGLMSDDSKAPNAQFSCKPIIEGISDEDKTNWEPDYPSGFEANNGLLFTHEGGDAISLDNIQIQIQSQDTKTTIDANSIFNASQSCVDETKLRTKTVGDKTEQVYFYKYGGGTDAYVIPGDKFMLVADGCYDSTGAVAAQGKYLTWKPTGSVGGFGATVNTIIEYKIIDKASGKAIQTGKITLQ